MKTWNILLAAAVALTSLGPINAVAEPRHHRDGDRDRREYRERHSDHGRHRERDRRHYRDTDRNYGYRHEIGCPPGLAKKDPACIPPGQARKHHARYGHGVGERLRIGDYLLIRDPSRYDLERRRGWDYYRDDNRIYRIDRQTQQILAVMNLIQAFSN